MTPLGERLALAVPLLVLCITLVSVPMMVFGPNGLPRHRRLRAQLSAQQEENRRLAREVIRVRTQLDAFNRDPRARERAVREELGWVRPDEVIIEVPVTSPRAHL